MRILLLILAFCLSSTLVDGGTDDYHNGDPAVVAAKARLLLASNPSDPAAKGGIRARTVTESINVAGLLPDLADVQRGKRNLAQGLDGFVPTFTGVSNAYKSILQRVAQYEASLDGNKTITDRAIQNFASNWESGLMKKIASNPDTYNSVFSKYNDVVMKEYHSLAGLSTSVNSTLVQQAGAMLNQNRKAMRAENKTLRVIGKQIAKAAAAYSELLNHRALPLLIGTKYATNANIARVGKATLDSLSTFQDTVIPAITDTGVKQIATSGDALVANAQRMVISASKQIQIKLTSLRSDLDQLAMKTSQYASKNFTQIDKTLSKAAVDVKASRTAGLAALRQKAAQATLLAQQFQRMSAAAAADLAKSTTAADSQLSAVTGGAKLNTQQMDSQFSAKISGVMSSMTPIKNTASGVNSVQSSISSTYSSSSSGVSSGLTTDLTGRVASALADASDMQDNLSGSFDSVSTATSEHVQGQLQTQVGVANVNLHAQQEAVVTRTTGLAGDIQAQIDESTADSDEAQAEVLGKFTKGMDQKNAVLSSMGDLNSRIAQRQAELTQRRLASDAAAVSQVSSGRDVMGNTSDALDSMEDRLSSISNNALPQLDADNEDRIKSAFSDLNELRRQGASQGDSFHTQSEEIVSDMISKAAGDGSPDGGWSTNTAALTQQTSQLKNAASAYRSQMAWFEASMNAQMKNISAKYDASTGSGVSAEVGQIVAAAQGEVSVVGRDLIRAIYNQSVGTNPIAQFVAGNARFNVPKYLGYLLSDPDFAKQLGIAKSRVVELNAKRNLATAGVDGFANYLDSLKGQIQSKLFVDLGDAGKVNAAIQLRRDTVAEINGLEKEMNATIQDHFRTANESIANKTGNFYRQFQTASVVADAVVMGFSDYVAKMIDVEKMSAKQRQAAQDTLIQSIQAHVADAPVTLKNATEIDRVNAMVKMAMDSSDTSAEGVRRRQAAADALVNEFGVDAAQKLQAKYAQLAGNAGALSKAIDASNEDMVSDRVAGLEGSKMGLEGVGDKTQIFSNQASDLVEVQKANARALAAKIDQLLSGNSFLTNVTGDELGAILKSVQDADALHANQLSQYKGSAGVQVATLGGVVEDFGNLVQDAIGRTTDFLNQLSANYTDLVERSDAVMNDPVNAVKTDLIHVRDQAETVNATLAQHVLSITPIEDGLQERIASLSQRQDEFAANVQKQLADYVATVHKMDGDVAVSRDDGMRKLRGALANLIDGFREQALQFQSAKVDKAQGSLLETRSEREIRRDMKSRIQLVKGLLHK